MISASTRRAKETASRNTLRWVMKNDSNKDLAAVWCHIMGYVSRLDLCKYYSLYGGMWNLFCRVRHYPCIQILPWCIQRRNPPCNAEDNIIEAWFRGY